MSDSVQMIFKLIDEASAPARSAMAALDGVTRALNVADSAAKHAKIDIPKVPTAEKLTGPNVMDFTVGALTKEDTAAQTAAIKESLSAVGAAAPPSALKIGLITAAAMAATQAIVAIGREAITMGVAIGRNVVDIAAWRSNTNMALEQLLGGKVAAADFSKSLEGIADKSPFTDKQLFDSSKMLLGAKFTADEVTTIIRGVGDAASFSGDSQMMGSIIQQLTQVKSLGHLAYEDLKQITQGSGGAVGADDVYKNIAAALGKTSDEAKKMVSSGTVDAQVGIAAILQTLKSGISGGNLGDFMAKQAETIPGLISTIQGRWERMIGSVESLPGLEPLRQGLAAVAGMLDKSTPAGERFSRILDKIINSSFGALFAGFDADSMVDTLDKVLNTLDAVGDAIGPVIEGVKAFGEGAFKGFMEAIKPMMDAISGSSRPGENSMAEHLRMLGEVIGWVAGKVLVGTMVIVGAVAWIVDEIVNLPSTLSGLNDTLTEAARSVVFGFWDGLKSAWAWMMGEWDGLVDLLPASVKKILGIHSPSKVFAELGMYTGLGFAIGIDSAANDVDASMAALVEPPEGGAFSGGAGGGAFGAGGAAASAAGGGGLVVNLEMVNNFGGGASPGDVDLERIKETAREGVAEAFREYRRAVGG